MSGYNLRILARNLLRESGVTITPTPAMVSSSLSEDNLLRYTERNRVARTSNLTGPEFYVELPSAGKANCAAVTRHNWTTAATLRTRIYGAGSPTPTLHDTTALAAYNTAGLDTDVDNYQAAYFAGLRNTVQYFDEQSGVWAARYNIEDAANPDGYIQQTQLWLGKAFSVTYDPPFGGLDLTPLDGSAQGRSADGTLITDVGWRARKLRINLEFIPDNDLPTMLAIVNYMGLGGECLIDVYPMAGNAKQIYHCGAFKLVEMPTFNPFFPGLHRSTLIFEET
jgi:hypothetical protein